MSEPRPFASLSPSLLARKGSARPAMRPQLRPLAFDDERPGTSGKIRISAPASSNAARSPASSVSRV